MSKGIKQSMSKVQNILFSYDEISKITGYDKLKIKVITL